MIFLTSRYLKKSFSFLNFDTFQVLLKTKEKVLTIFLNQSFNKNHSFQFFFEHQKFLFFNLKRVKNFLQPLQFFSQLLFFSARFFYFKKSEIFLKQEKILFSFFLTEKNSKKDFSKVMFFLKTMNFFSNFFSCLTHPKMKTSDLFFANLKKFPYQRNMITCSRQDFCVFFACLERQKRKHFFFFKNQILFENVSLLYKNQKDYQTLQLQSIEKNICHHSKKYFQFFQKIFFVKNLKKRMFWKWFLLFFNKSFFENQFSFKFIEGKKVFKQIFSENFFFFLKNFFFWTKDLFFSFSNFFFSSPRILQKKFQKIKSGFKKKKTFCFFLTISQKILNFLKISNTIQTFLYILFCFLILFFCFH